MAQEIIGRKQEMKQLALCSSSGKAEFVAVYGRRRVVKHSSFVSTSMTTLISISRGFIKER